MRAAEMSAQTRHERSEDQARRLTGVAAAREVVPIDPSLSGRWHMHGVPGPYARWNYHPEYEVHLVRYGKGSFVVGDHIDAFAGGQLVLVGSHLPHHWISDLSRGETQPDRDVVFQFHPDWVEKSQSVFPELSYLSLLLKRSSHGIEFSGSTARTGAAQLEAIGATSGPTRLGHIFGLLGIMAAAPAHEWKLLAKAWLPPVDDQSAAEIVDRAFSYIIDNLDVKISLTEAALLVGMSDSAFSRYFKRMSGQTFTDTVRKLRLTQACRLLRETDLPISSICYRVGFANLANFNRQFRALYDVTPSSYRRSSHS